MLAALKDYMPNYKWTCLVCEETNKPNSKLCAFCGCLSDASRKDIDKWYSSIESRNTKPSFNLNNFALWGELAVTSHRTSPCPKCRMHMYISGTTCPHCKHELSFDERNDLILWHKKTNTSGALLGLFVFTMLIILGVAIAYAKNIF